MLYHLSHQEGTTYQEHREKQTLICVLTHRFQLVPNVYQVPTHTHHRDNWEKREFLHTFGISLGGAFEKRHNNKKIKIKKDNNLGKVFVS
jgi:hypothetical protein